MLILRAMKTKNIILSVLLLSIWGCKDTFLEVDPKAEYFEDNFFKSNDQVFQGLVAAYDPLQWSYIDGRWTSTVLLGEIWSDNANAGGGTETDQPGWQQIDDFSNTSQTLESATFWKKGYFGIYKASLVINNVDITLPILDTVLVRQYQAEAKFLRALYHFELVRAFGPIPVITSSPDPADKNYPRNTLSEVYTQITKDLEEAIPLLPETYPDAFVGRATKGAAQALLGKAYLYWADLLNDDVTKFDKAASALIEVINGGNYDLVDDYNDLYAFGTANTIESVFEIQYTNEVPEGWDSPFESISGNMIVQLCGVRSLCATHPNYAPGWGFMLPTNSLSDHFFPDDVYRKRATIITEFDLALEAGGACSIDQGDQNQADYTGMWQRKYANYKNYTAPNGGDPVMTKDANQPYIRYAEVLLMYAEALVRGTGADADAHTYINMVRERAFGPGNNDGNYRTSQDLMTDEGLTLLEVIWYERRAELAGEGDRWFDLVRSGRAAASLFPNNDLRATNFSEQSMYLPAPQVDVDFTGGIITPYPDASLFQ